MAQRRYWCEAIRRSPFNVVSNTTKFDTLAGRYAEFRPGYPAAIFERIRELTPSETLAARRC